MNSRTLTALLMGVVLLHSGLAAAQSASNRQTAAKAPARAAPAQPPQPVETPLELDRFGNPVLGSPAFVVVSQKSGEVIVEQRSDAAVPIASITKLMTAMVVLDARQNLKEVLTVTNDDIDRLKGTSSRLAIGTRLTREEMLHLALMSSENRAASALARHYPGGSRAFIEAMNVKARMLGLWGTRFADSTGLDPRNVSTARDLVNLVQAASTYPLIREFSTADERYVRVGNGQLRYGNSNGLVRDPEWQVSLSKTGYIREAGRCLVMQTWVRGEPVIMVLMGSEGRYTRTADAKRVKRWLETAGGQQRLAAVAAAARSGG